MIVKKPDKITPGSGIRGVNQSAKGMAKDKPADPEGASYCARAPGQPKRRLPPLVKGNVPAKQPTIPQWAKQVMKPAKAMDKGSKNAKRGD